MLETSLRFMQTHSITETSTQLAHLSTSVTYQFKAFNPNFVLTAPTTTIIKIISVQPK